jgi:hypothetical protein
MSPWDRSKSQAFFIVQSGIVAWEDLEPIADWKQKTLSVVGRQLSVVTALLWDIVASRPQRFGRVLRYSVAAIPSFVTESQRRRWMAQLTVDRTGFSETIAHITATQVCVTEVLREPSAVDPDSLTAHRYCALVELDDRISSVVEHLEGVCTSIHDLTGSGIATLLGSAASVAILRVLDRESCAVLQLIGPSEVSDRAVQCLAERGVRQFHDIRALPQEIAKLRE